MNWMNEAAETNWGSDATAIERTIAGDRDAFRLLVDRHSRYVFRLAYRLTGNQQDAEEVVQEAFLRAYQKLEQFEARANFGTWVYRIASNYAIDRMRQRRKEEARMEAPAARQEDGDNRDPLDLIADSSPTPERLTQSVELKKRMQQALSELTEAERTAFIMRHWEGCGIEEISAALKTSSSATKNTVFRSVQKLRKLLEPHLGLRPQVKAMGSEL